MNLLYTGTDRTNGDMCIPHHYRCDKVNDCTDGSDESGCDYVCPVGKHACSSGALLVNLFCMTMPFVLVRFKMAYTWNSSVKMIN